MSAASREWTPQQKAAIDTVGCSVLVSAAAGSGKTAVLAERCAHLVCHPSSPCDVDQLLVVTFTESAAAQMKARIQEALRDRLTRKPTERLARQVALVEHAHVSTVHGFCSRLLRQNFNLVGLDPDFRILDGDEAALLRNEIAVDLFHRRYDADKSGDFHRFIDAYGDGNDEQLISQVIRMHELLNSLVNPGLWIARALSEIEESANQPMESSRLGRQLIEQISQALRGLRRQCEDARESVVELGAAFDGYVEQLGELGPVLGHWQNLLATEGLNMLVSEFRDFHLPRAPNIKGKAENKELAKSILDGVKKVMVSKELAELLSLTSGQWQQGMKEIAPHARVLLSLVEEFASEYDAAKGAARSVDFSDLERLALNVLCEDAGAEELEPSATARSLHQQFRHVLVDEYQDINEIQDAILTLVSHESASREGRRGNLFCVGDVKQSIFRFRLAEPARFIRRQDRFSSKTESVLGKLIHLRENFRSRAPLLECINAVFERLMTRAAAEIEYDQTHRLSAGLKYPAPGKLPEFKGAPVELHVLPAKLAHAGSSQTQVEEADPDVSSESESEAERADMERADYEAVLAARCILRMTGRDGSPPMQVMKRDAAGNLAPSPIGLSDIVILLRSMQFKADTFADVLRGHDIPVHSEGGQGFFQATEVRDILCLLQVLDNQQQDIPLAAVLRSPLAGLPEADDALAQIRIRYRAAAQPGPQSDAEEIPFHVAVVRYAEEQKDELAAHLREFLGQLQAWREQANTRPVAELLWQLYDETGYLAYCSGLADGQQRVANLVQLHQRAAQFGTFLRQGLYRFLRFLQSLREQKDLSRPSVVSEAEQVVRIMSIHRSKGLEFPVVLLPDLGKRHNMQDTQGAILVDRQAGLGMSVVDPERMIRYPSLAGVLVKSSLLRQTLAEEMRLLYVAMTRAKEHLILIGTCPEKSCERWTNQWRQHPGALPADVVLGGHTVLDWLGPVAAMTAANPSAALEIIAHSPDEVRTWENPRARPSKFSALQQAMANLQPCNPAPHRTAAAQQVIDRFEAEYRYANFAKQAATASVTSLAKDVAGEDAAGGLPAELDSQPRHTPFERKLDLPTFFFQAEPKATEKGNATHLVLQHWDFAVAACDAGEIKGQIDGMLARKLISSKEASLVDPSAIGWFLRSDLGQLLRANHLKLMREVPFALAVPPRETEGSAAPEAMDQLMVRGRIDLLFPTDAGLSIVDYKTDNVTGADIDARVELYRKQMFYYRQAVRDVAKMEVATIYLVFLGPQVIREV